MPCLVNRSPFLLQNNGASGILKNEISFELFKRLIDEFDEKPDITFSGGEPLLHPDIWKGKHNDLMQKNQSYREFYKSQAKWYV